MNKYLLAAVISIASAGAASAADLAARPYTKAPAPIAAVYNWSGFYVGLNGGGGWSSKCWDLRQLGPVIANPAVAEGCHDATGATVGGQIGYRWQASNWVFGLEAQGNWADISGSNRTLAPMNLVNRSTVDALGLFTGQVGYSWSNVLWYVKGGAAVTRDKYEGTDSTTGILVDRATETRWGAAVGTGLEFGFSPNWSLAIEYDHLFMGARDISLSTPAGVLTRVDRISQDVDMVTARINYRFGGPVVAKY